MTRDIKEILKTYWGYDDFRSLQEETIRSVLDGKDTLALMPTGGGKSLTYQVSGLAMEGVCLVVTPLIALMKDQVEDLKNRQIPAEAIYTGMRRDRVESIINKCIYDTVKFLYVSPERLYSERFREKLRLMNVCLITVDEAHCISQWGYDFRPPYLRIAEVREFFPGVATLALTATATPEVVEDIQKQLHFSTPNVLSKSFRRENISYVIRDTEAKPLELFNILSKVQGGAIVYVRTRLKASSIAAFLNKSGIKSDFYHAGLSSAQRARRQEAWKSGMVPVVVATNAFGMGIDKPDVRFVVHIGLPKSIEAYFQETGRAGRDGKPSEAWLIWGWRDVMIQQQFIESGDGSPEFKQQSLEKLDAMVGYAETGECRRHYLLACLGEESSTHCGCCDNCDRPPEMADRTVDAQKFVSCVIRCERASGCCFGMTHVINVLRGERTSLVAGYGHEKLSTWGIGKDLSEEEWRELARVLIARRILNADWKSEGVLRPGRAKALLKGEETILVRVSAPSRPDLKQGRVRKPIEVREDYRPLADALRAWRRETAEAQGIPAYRIMTDVSLSEVASIHPQSFEALSHVNGIGPKKLDAYGTEILHIVRDFMRKKKGTEV